MNIQDLFTETFYDEDEILNEGIFLTPFLAFTSFKKDAFNKVKGSFTDLNTNVDKFARDKKAQALITKEIARASMGIKSGKGDDATVYKLTKEQIDIMADIYKKYGKDIAKDVIEFRKNILAPYELIKRKVKENSKVTNKDRLGLTYAEFKTAVESGKKKIESRGDNYFEKSEELRDRVDKYDEQINTLYEAKKSLENEGKLDEKIVRRIMKKFELGEDKFLGYSKEELKKRYDQFKERKNYAFELNQKLKDAETDKEREELFAKQSPRIEREFLNFVERAKNEKEKDDEKEKKKGSFDIAFSRYMIYQGVRDKLVSDENNIFKRTYLNITDELIKDIKERREETFDKLKNLRKTVEFNDKEKKVWKLRKGVKHFSDDINDYYQAIREKDFIKGTGVIHIPKSEKLEKAERKIQNEIKRFHRKLENKMEPEDFNKLKKYRLINDLIAVREMKSEEKLFKDAGDFKQDFSDKDVNVIDKNLFIKRMNQIANNTYSTIPELTKAKSEASNLMKKMRKQEPSLAGEYNKVYDQIQNKTIEKEEDTINLKTIKNFAEEVISYQYRDATSARNDMRKLAGYIDKYKKDNPLTGEEDLENISNIIDNAKAKLKKEGAS